MLWGLHGLGFRILGFKVKGPKVPGLQECRNES